MTILPTPPVPMDLYGATLKRPAWMNDRTWYEFRFPTGHVGSLAVEAQIVPPEALEYLVTQRRARMLGGPGVQSPDITSYPGPFPARGFSLQPKGTAETMCLVALATPGRATTILSTGAVGHDQQLSDWLARAAALPATCVLRQQERPFSVLGLSLPLPEDAIPPRSFQLGGERSTLVIDWVKPTSAPPSVDPGEAFSLGPDAGVEVRPAQHWHRRDGSVVTDTWTVDARGVVDGDAVDLFVGGARVVREGSALDIFAKAEASDAPRLRAEFTAIVVSVLMEVAS
ncbi:MAG: hypothetical protein JW751_17585 [Polyangiaceae bacterium]|nr:hypothetical protein [Polyangiaceae bacterium]